MDARARSLHLFVSFAGDEDNISRPGPLNGNSDRLAAVGLDGERGLGALQPGKRIIDDRHRVLAPGIVGSEDNVIAAPPRGFAHQRALGAIAIAATAKDGDHLASALRDEFAGE
jgi:hypothetical protein